jgi:nucleotide-binding universal stress UspA family protein
MIRRIVCPTDFSSASARAVEHAIALAAWYGGSLRLLHVAPDTITPASELAYLGNPGLLDPGLQEPEERRTS